jgi:hypothetical protein
MNLNTIITAVVTLSAVLIGGWLTWKGEDRLSRRERERHWRDTRLAAYLEFLVSFRQYIAYVLEPDSRIRAIPHPRRPGDLMPFFEGGGTTYRERLEASKTTLRLVALSEETIERSRALVRLARQVAAARSDCDAGSIPHEQFEKLWVAEWMFVSAARAELNLRELNLANHVQ